MRLKETFLPSLEVTNLRHLFLRDLINDYLFTLRIFINLRDDETVVRDGLV